jgi:hypothetical protein
MMGTRQNTMLAICAALSLAFAWPCAASDRYVRASVDEAGHLRILTSDGRTITIPKEGEQVGFEQIAISPDGASVGWVGLRENCCTSYPIPTRLVIYTAGKSRTFKGIDLPVFRWAFKAGGRQVAFHQDTVHGGYGEHYEWLEIASGRLIAAYSPRRGPDNHPLPNQVVPRWVKELNAKR